MYLYTPTAHILRRIEGARKSRNIDATWILATEYCTEYVTKSIFLRDYPNVKHYSRKRLQMVPVTGYLFPVDMFDETVVDV